MFCIVAVFAIGFVVALAFYTFESGSFFSRYTKKEMKYVNETINHVESLLKDPTSKNVIEATHLYHALPHILHSNHGSPELRHSLICNMLDLINRTSGNKLTSKTITPDYLLSNYTNFSKRVEVFEFLRSEIDSLYEKHIDSSSKTKSIRLVDKAIDFEAECELDFEWFKEFSEAFDNGVVTEKDSPPFEGHLELSKYLLILYGLMTNQEFEYMDINFSDSETWNRGDLNKYNTSTT